MTIEEFMQTVDDTGLWCGGRQLFWNALTAEWCVWQHPAFDDSTSRSVLKYTGSDLQKALEVLEIRR